MTRRARRIVFPLIAILVVAGIAAIMFFGPEKPDRSAPETPGDATEVAQDDSPGPDDAASDPSTTEDRTPADADADTAGDLHADADADPDAPGGALSAADTTALTDLQAIAPVDRPADATPTALGSLHRREADLLVTLTPRGAGILSITCADHWETAHAKQQAARHWAALEAGEPAEDVPALPPTSLRYVVDQSQPVQFGSVQTTIPVLAAHSIRINGQSVDVMSSAAWSETEPGRFETVIQNGDGQPVLRITRAYTLDGYDITLRQSLQNLSGQPLSVQWIQYGPSDLAPDVARYMDRRRFRFGYLLGPEQDPSRTVIIGADNDFIVERASALDRWEEFDADDEPDEILNLWPTADVLVAEAGERPTLSWFASTNRYFATAMHPLLGPDLAGDRSIEGAVESIRLRAFPNPQASAEDEEQRLSILTNIYSPVLTLPAGETARLDLGLFAGPLSERVLEREPLYQALHLDALVLYQMSTFCAICTFQWLAHLLLNMLLLLHDYVVFDWAVAIIVLVCIVRLLLHPLVKRSQIHMQRFGRAMQKMKPDLDRLKKKYGDDPKRMQQENLRLMREHGVSPFGMLGCLPLLLQTPIWVALYAMLYFAFDIRHEAAFYGIFQNITLATAGSWWPFLADLSSADHFFGQLDEPVQFLGFWRITGFNLLPFVMAAVLFVQQKYMTPPPSPSMTDEQRAQQKMMRVMTVVIMPLFLYSAPSGLTLYILTSSTIAIFESRYVRAHIDQLELEPKKPDSKAAKKKDALAKRYDAMLKAHQEKRKGPPKSFKKRK